MNTAVGIRKRVKPKESVRNFCAVASRLLLTMPINAASKHVVRTALRSAVNKSCPNYRGNDNKKNVQYVSAKAARLLKSGVGGLVADHAMPLSLLWKSIYSEKIFEVDKLVEIVGQYSVMVLLTKDEDDLLRKAGLAKKMPEGWSRGKLLARYEMVGIRLRPITLPASDRC